MLQWVTCNITLHHTVLHDITRFSSGSGVTLESFWPLKDLSNVALAIDGFPTDKLCFTGLLTFASVSYFLQQVAVSPPPMMEVAPQIRGSRTLPRTLVRASNPRQSSRSCSNNICRKCLSRAQTALCGCYNIIHQNFSPSFKTSPNLPVYIYAKMWKHGHRRMLALRDYLVSIHKWLHVTTIDMAMGLSTG